MIRKKIVPKIRKTFPFWFCLVSSLHSSIVICHSLLCSGAAGVPYCLNNDRQAVSCGVPKCARDTICQKGLGEGYRGDTASTTLGYTCQVLYFDKLQ